MLLFTKNMLLLMITFGYTGLTLTFWSGVYGTCLGRTKHFGEEAKSLVGLHGIGMDIHIDIKHGDKLFQIFIFSVRIGFGDWKSGFWIIWQAPGQVHWKRSKDNLCICPPHYFIPHHFHQCSI